MEGYLSSFRAEVALVVAPLLVDEGDVVLQREPVPHLLAAEVANARVVVVLSLVHLHEI